MGHWQSGQKKIAPAAWETTISTKNAFWAIYARGYDLAWDSGFTADVAASIQQQIASGATVVDLGAGTGLLSQGLLERNCQVTGVDTSRVMLTRALSRRRITKGVQADAAQTGLPTASADVVLGGNLLHLHPNPSAVVDEAVRLARPGALIAWTTPAAGITGGRVWAADRRHGRSAAAATVAYFVRADIARLATLSRVRVTPHPQVENVLCEGQQRHKLALQDSYVLDGVQSVTIMVKPNTL